MASHSIGVREGLIIGLLAHVQGIRLLLLHPWLLLHCLPGGFVAISSALSASCAIWAGSLILRLPPVRLVLPFDSILRCTCVVVFNISTLRIWASFSGRGFFAAYRTLSPSDAIALQRRTILHGLFAQLRHLLTTLLAGVGLIALLAGTAALWMPWLLAAGAAGLGSLVVLSSSPMAAASLLAAIGLGVVLGRTFAPAVSLFLTLKRSLIPRGVAAALVLLAISGLLPASAVRGLVEMASAYLLALLHAKQLLVRHSQLRARTLSCVVALRTASAHAASASRSKEEDERQSKAHQGPADLRAPSRPRADLSPRRVLRLCTAVWIRRHMG